MTGAGIIISVYNALEFARACIEGVYEAGRVCHSKSSWWATVLIPRWGFGSRGNKSSVSTLTLCISTSRSVSHVP